MASNQATAGPRGTQQAGEINNYNIDTTSDFSHTHQGPVHGGIDMTQCTPTASEETMISGSSDTSSHANHTECERCRVWRERDHELIKQVASTHENNPVEWPNKAYFSLSDPSERQDVRPGHIYRIWQPGNFVIHRSTVLVMIDRHRSLSVCKLEKDEHIIKRRNWKHYWAPIHIHTLEKACTKVNRTEEQAECHELTVLPEDGQLVEKKCHVELERSYDIGNEDEYHFVYCGQLDEDSFTYAKKKHRNLYCSG